MEYKKYKGPFCSCCKMPKYEGRHRMKRMRRWIKKEIYKNFGRAISRLE